MLFNERSTNTFSCFTFHLRDCSLQSRLPGCGWPHALNRTPNGLRDSPSGRHPSQWNSGIPFLAFWFLLFLQLCVGSSLLSPSPFVHGFPHPSDATGTSRLCCPGRQGFILSRLAGFARYMGSASSFLQTAHFWYRPCLVGVALSSGNGGRFTSRLFAGRSASVSCQAHVTIPPAKPEVW